MGPANEGILPLQKTGQLFRLCSFFCSFKKPDKGCRLQRLTMQSSSLRLK